MTIKWEEQRGAGKVSRQRKGLLTFLLAAMLLLNSSPAVFAKQFFGYGGASCGTWLEARRDRDSS
jgi:hypothetical protein